VGSSVFGTEMISYMANLFFSTAINILDLFDVKWVNILCRNSICGNQFFSIQESFIDLAFGALANKQCCG
jgi:hypothetical protein